MIIVLIVIIACMLIIFKNDIIKNNHVIPFIKNTPKSISGIVVVGHGLAKKINYPTANIKLSQKTNLKPGLYIGNCFINKKKYDIVFRINRQQDYAFAYLNQFTGDLYDETIEINNIYHLNKKLIDFIQRYHNFLDDLHNTDNSLNMLYED
jgi:hypothetical protein